MYSKTAWFNEVNECINEPLDLIFNYYFCEEGE
jgi:hypothetical protein